jgi:branched-chain amino acid transport system ATP-binding protein
VLLEVDDIHTFYSKSHILHGVTMDLEEGETVTLLGRNGVGKSTTLKSIAGLAPPRRGSVRFKGQESAGLKPYQLCRLGIGYVPEERRIFPKLTVRQNLLVGPRLEERDGQRGGNLSGGEQQMLTIGRTLMGNPEAILVDEPTEGLAPLLVKMVTELLRDIHSQGHSILLVEQAMDVALELADRAYVMSKGEIVWKGTPDELRADDQARKTYLEV